MKVGFTPKGLEQFLHWVQNDPKTASRICELIKMSVRDPFEGIGKPEPLQGQLQGWWSRRITGAHRFVYRVVGKGEIQALEIAACRFHYEK